MLKQFQSLGIFVFFGFSACTLYSYLTPEVVFSYSMIYGCFVWSILVWIVLSVYYVGFGVYFGSVTYITYRFKQVNKRIKDCVRNPNVSDLMLSVKEHHQICSLNERSNKLLCLILLELYYVASVFVDLSLVIIIHMNTTFMIRSIYIGMIVLIVPLVYSLAYVSARLTEAARGSYGDLNSIMATQDIRYSKMLRFISKNKRFKIINLIERLAQTEISVWCLDLFPLNNFEFYLFIAATAKNFFLFTDLISNDL